MAAAVIMTFVSGCSEDSASSPEAVVKINTTADLRLVKRKIYTEDGYKAWIKGKEAVDTLSIKKVEKNKDNDRAVVFFTFMEDGKDNYDVMICKKLKDGPWVKGNMDDLKADNKFKEEMRKQISDWEK